MFFEAASIVARHEVRIAREMGWHQLENGDLLTAGEGAGFDVFGHGWLRLQAQRDLWVASRKKRVKVGSVLAKAA